jgi:hypothetical protein
LFEQRTDPEQRGLAASVGSHEDVDAPAVKGVERNES